MKEKLLIEIPIPMAWTGTQAKAVWEFLGIPETAVFDAHETEILKAVQNEHLAEIKKNRKIDYAQLDDIPF